MIATQCSRDHAKVMPQSPPVLFGAGSDETSSRRRSPVDSQACAMVSLLIAVIFRVKSAQKIRLTDRRLLTRLAPILAVYLVYLLAWSLAGEVRVIVHKDLEGRSFKGCSFDWWDHASLICKYRVRQ
ncbi:hypothetical protein QZH41_003304 [Actinostola sp. cb2023]|nr:hypothetical protein QZH41_003304 [Actinostola sp. cb2023]